MPIDFRIADSFTDSLGRLNGQERTAAKTTVFDYQVNPSAPGLKFHRIDKSKDPNFWSLRVNRDLRIIVHKTSGNILLCYVDHHDKAYAWAERRRIEAHPRTGTIQSQKFFRKWPRSQATPPSLLQELKDHAAI